jgi:hypothetical protein
MVRSLRATTAEVSGRVVGSSFSIGSRMTFPRVTKPAFEVLLSGFVDQFIAAILGVIQSIAHLLHPLLEIAKFPLVLLLLEIEGLSHQLADPLGQLLFGGLIVAATVEPRRHADAHVQLALLDYQRRLLRITLLQLDKLPEIPRHPAVNRAVPHRVLLLDPMQFGREVGEGLVEELLDALTLLLGELLLLTTEPFATPPVGTTVPASILRGIPAVLLRRAGTLGTSTSLFGRPVVLLGLVLLFGLPRVCSFGDIRRRILRLG